MHESQLGDPLTQSVVGVGMNHHDAHGLAHLGKTQRGAPTAMQDVQTNLSGARHVAVVDWRFKMESRRRIWVVGRKRHLQSKSSSCERRVRRTREEHLHRVNVVGVGKDVHALSGVHPRGAGSLRDQRKLLHDAPGRLSIGRPCRLGHCTARKQSTARHGLDRLDGATHGNVRCISATRDCLRLHRGKATGRHFTSHELRPVVAPSSRLERHDGFAFHQFKSFGERTNLKAGPAGQFDDFAKILVWSVAHDDAVDGGADLIARCKSRLRTCAAVRLPVREQQDAKIHAVRGGIKAWTKHCTRLSNCAVDAGHAALFDVVDDALEEIQRGSQRQQSLDFGVELNQTELVCRLQRFRPVAKRVENLLDGVHARPVVENFVESVGVAVVIPTFSLVKSCAHGSRVVDADRHALDSISVGLFLGGGFGLAVRGGSGVSCVLGRREGGGGEEGRARDLSWNQLERLHSLRGHVLVDELQIFDRRRSQRFHHDHRVRGVNSLSDQIVDCELRRNRGCHGCRGLAD